MTKCSFIFAFLISVSLAFGQFGPIDSNTITVTASQSATLQPDQVVFSINVSSDLNTSLDDVLAALSGSGISAGNFVGVFANLQWLPTTTTTTTNSTTTGLDWSFRWPVAWSKMKDTMTMLIALQKSIPQKNSTLTLSFGVSGPQVSPQLLQMQTCSIPDLLSAARNQAQKLASAANLFVGAVLAMSSSTSGSPDFASPLPYYSSAFPTTCALTVKFAVTR